MKDIITVQMADGALPLTGSLPPRLEAKASQEQRSQFRRLCIQLSRFSRLSGEGHRVLGSIIMLLVAIERDDPEQPARIRRLRRKKRLKSGGIQGRFYGVGYGVIPVLSPTDSGCKDSLD
jgi:hypothetical protein